MSLVTGQWTLNGNGFQGDLTITAADADGTLHGTMYGGQPIIGFWDETAQKITFMKIVPPPSGQAPDPSTYQVYTGYLFSNGTEFTLAGSFEAFAGSGGTASRTVFGWTAFQGNGSNNRPHARCGWIGSEGRVPGGGPGAQSFQQNAWFFKAIHPFLYVPAPNGDLLPGHPSYGTVNNITLDPVVVEASRPSNTPGNVHDQIPIWPTIFSTAGDRGTQGSATLDQLLAILANPSDHIGKIVGELQRLRAAQNLGDGLAGIDIDYEALPADRQTVVTSFITNLVQQMHQAGFKVSVTVGGISPAYLCPEHGGNTGNTAFEYVDLVDTGVDAIHVMTYDKHGNAPSPAHAAGPNCPVWFLRYAMKAAALSAEHSQTGREAPKRFVFGMPNYGRDFGTLDANGNPVIFSLGEVNDHLKDPNAVTTDDPHDSDSCPPGDTTCKCPYRIDDAIDPSDPEATSGIQPNGVAKQNENTRVFFETLASLQQRVEKVATFQDDSGTQIDFGGVTYFPLGNELPGFLEMVAGIFTDDATA
jgi:spore germination protein YaaH